MRFVSKNPLTQFYGEGDKEIELMFGERQININPEDVKFEKIKNIRSNQGKRNNFLDQSLVNHRKVLFKKYPKEKEYDNHIPRSVRQFVNLVNIYSRNKKISANKLHQMSGISYNKTRKILNYLKKGEIPFFMLNSKKTYHPKIVDNLIKEMLETNNVSSLGKIKSKLISKLGPNFKITRKFISRKAKKNKFVYKKYMRRIKTVKKKENTNKKLRRKISRKLVDFMISDHNIVYVDEISFNLDSKPKGVWVKKSAKLIDARLDKGEFIHAMVAYSKGLGVLGIQFIRNAMTSKDFIIFVLNYLES